MIGRHRPFACITRFTRVFLLLGLAVPFSSFQVQKPPAGQSPEQGDKIIRVQVGLVQTDVMVFDRRGSFVDNLRQDQFELRVDGKVQPISFFELVSTGSQHDEEIWAKAEGKPVPAAPNAAAASANPGRTLLLFLDDWHLTEDSVMRSRVALANLLNTSMGPKDRVGIFTASGQLSSMQELTNDKAALLASLQKFNFKSAGAQDLSYPPMTEAQALAIEYNDLDMITYFVQSMTGKPVVKTTRGWENTFDRFGDISKECSEAEKTTRGRASELAQMSAGIGERTLSSLRGILRAAEALPGRKVVFFLSDGFVLQPQKSNIVSRLREITTAAARNGIVIYSLDARGLVVGLPDARTKRASDPTSAAVHSGINEVTAPQDALNALAADTGGRFLKNTNALDTALITTLSEISRYYLLGWPIDPASMRPGMYRTIRVAIKGRKDLSVRVRQGSLDFSQLTAAKGKAPESTTEPSAGKIEPDPFMIRSGNELYAKARSVVDLTREELLQAYPLEMNDLVFEEESAPLDSLLQKAGEHVAAFYTDFPKTLAREQVYMERLDNDGKVADSVARNYLYSFSPDKTGKYWEEDRTESNGHPVDMRLLKGFLLAPGRVGICMFLHPGHRDDSRFRYLGRQASDPGAHVIAFAQDPAKGAYLGSFQAPAMAMPAPVLYQGLVWLDPRTFQIVRMRTDLLAPRSDIGLSRQTTEAWFSEVPFQSIGESFWLPREVLITNVSLGITCRNRHRYSNYQVFTVAVQEKVITPPVKK